VDQDSDGKRLAISNAQVVDRLIKARANVNIQNQQGNTPLHLAYLRRDQAMIARLKQAGAREDIRNDKGEYPAQLALKTYGEARAILNDTVRVYLLDERLFLHPIAGN
jgi:ankyrin repeat protein